MVPTSLDRGRACPGGWSWRSTNINNLYSLQSRTPYFTPDLDAAPTSLTVSIFYGINASGNATNFPYPVDLALDAADDVFLLYGSAAPGANTVTAVAEMYASGASAGYVTNNQYGYPSQIAMATNGNVYTTNNDGATGAVLRMQNTGALSPVVSLANASGVAVDINNNLWISAANTRGRSMNEYKYANISASNGAATADFFTGAIGNIPGLAIDGMGGVWGVQNVSGGNSSAVNLYNSGSVNAPNYSATGYNTIGLGAGNAFWISLVPTSTGVDGGYFPLNGQLATAGSYLPNGNQLYTAAVTTTTGSAAPNRNAMDGAGNVFWSNLGSNGLLWIFTPPAPCRLPAPRFRCFPATRRRTAPGTAACRVPTWVERTCAAWRWTAPAAFGWAPTLAWEPLSRSSAWVLPLGRSSAMQIQDLSRSQNLPLFPPDYGGFESRHSFPPLTSRKSQLLHADHSTLAPSLGHVKCRVA